MAIFKPMHRRARVQRKWPLECQFEERRAKYLDKLPEPVLVVGHMHPDPDVISSAAVLLNYFEKIGKPAMFSYTGDFPVEFLWCFDKNVHPSAPSPASFVGGVDIDELDYGSLIVVDSIDDSVRLGFNPKDVPTLVLEHHISSRDRAEDSDKYLFSDSPSTASLLYDIFGLDDSLIYVGLYYDALFYNARVKECGYYLDALRSITDEVIEQYHSLLHVRKDPSIIDSIRNAAVYLRHLDNGLVLGLITSDGPSEHKIPLLLFFLDYVDVLVLFNSKTGHISFRLSKKIQVNLSQFVKPKGGGGHKGAAGMNLASDESFQELMQEFMDWLEANYGDAQSL